MPRYRNNIMVKLDRNKRITLSSGRIFYTKFKRVKASFLPANVRIKRTYTRRKRREKGQQGRRLKDVLRKVLVLQNKPQKAELE